MEAVQVTYEDTGKTETFPQMGETVFEASVDYIAKGASSFTAVDAVCVMLTRSVVDCTLE